MIRKSAIPYFLSLLAAKCGLAVFGSAKVGWFILIFQTKGEVFLRGVL